jgi:hypothetical protein
LFELTIAKQPLAVGAESVGLRLSFDTQPVGQ